MIILPSPSPVATSVRPAPPPPRRRALPWLLLVGWAAQVGVRLWFARARTAPVAGPDEHGYLLAARLMAGGPGGDLSDSTFYQGGYPLLLTPVYWATRDPATVYLLVMVVNALVGAALFPLAYALARRLGLAPATAFPVAWATAALPAATFFGTFVLADAVLPVVVLGWLLLVDRFARSGRAVDAVGASAVAAYAYAVHTRGTVLLAVHVAVLASLAVRHRRAAAFGAGAAVAGYGAVSALNGWLRAELYPRGPRDLGGLLAERLTTADGLAWMVSGGVGQLWYLMVSTWGLGAVGLVAAGVVLLRRGTAAETRLMAGTLLALTFAIACASSGALPDEHRVGNFAYGRYLSPLASVYALAGLAVLVRARTRVAVRTALVGSAAIAATGLWVLAFAGERLRTHRYIEVDFPETGFLTWERGAFLLPQASLAAFALLGAFLLLRRRGWALLAAVNLAAMTFVIGPSPQRVAPVPLLPGPAAGGVAVAETVAWRVRVSLVDQVWWTGVTRFDPRTGPPANACTVVTPRGATWPGRTAGWRAHDRERAGYPWTAWRSPNC